MKSVFTIVLICLCSTVLGQPHFYGVADYKGGSIFKFDAAANNITTVYKHQLNEVFPTGSLSKGKDGLLYGMTLTGGAEGTGAIFSYDAAQKHYKVLYTFAAKNGSHPTGEIAWGPDGKMYGLATYGGATNNGVLFSFDTQAGTFEHLYSFDGATGANPIGGLYKDSDGKLYGITQLGGANGEGVLFSFDPAQRVFKKHFDFNPAKGSYPCTGLTKGKDGKLYGATAAGGPEEWFSGSIYQFDQKRGTVSSLYYFNWQGDQGYEPVSRLTLMPDGKLYGATSGGGSNYAGVIFSFDPAQKAYAKLYDFSEASGATPAGHLVAGSDGTLYGTTKEGNSYNYGGVFSFNPATSKFQNLHALQYAEGINPAGTVCIGNDGLLYALTTFGGSPEYGTLFSINPKTSAYTKWKEWDEAPDGAYPQAALTRHTNGLYYGSTIGGGHFGKGVIYSFNPANEEYSVAHRFGAAAGQYMNGGFLAGKDGRLYGLMNGGGTGSAGQLFSFDPATGVVQALYNFEQATGANPDGSLLAGDDGKYYGTASGGGNGHGALFSYNPATGMYAPLFLFDGAAGSVPMDGFAKGADGKLYGVTQRGGAADMGVLYAFDPVTGVYAKLFHFSGADGEYPLKGVVAGKDGKLYGTTPTGGAHGQGVLYCYNPESGTYTVLFHFDEAQGANPNSRLSAGSDGHLYGTTRRGGTGNQGVVFAFKPQTGTYAMLKSFGGSGSGQPSGGSLSEYCAQPQTFYRDRDGDGFGNEGQSIQACSTPVGYTSAGNDCNDSNATIKPGGAEICGNGVDDNCNGQTDETCTQMPVLLVKDLMVSEAQGVAIVEVTLSKPVDKGVKVHFATFSGTALSGWDFGKNTGLLKFDEGDTKATIKIKIMRDNVKEGNEQFRIFFWKPKELTLTKNVVVITIKDSNIPFRGNNIAAGSKVGLLPESDCLRLLAYPNPALHQFTLLPSTQQKEMLSATVVNASGSVVEVLRNLQPNQPFVLGGRYAPGLYLVRLTQGSQTTTIKLIKQP